MTKEELEQELQRERERSRKLAVALYSLKEINVIGGETRRLVMADVINEALKEYENKGGEGE